MIFLEKRKCDKIVSKDYKIKEFQYYYSLDLNIQVHDFTNFDTSEVISFVELDISDLIKLLIYKVKNIKGKDSEENDIVISINDLDQAYIKNGLYISLLTKLNLKRGKGIMQRKIRKLYRTTNHQKKRKPEDFYFDEGKVCNSKDYKKDNIKYSVQLVNTDRNTDNYIVSLLAIINHKPIPQLLKKEFSSKRGTSKYFNEICELVENNTNQDIINKCYEDKFLNMGKVSFFSRLF